MVHLFYKRVARPLKTAPRAGDASNRDLRVGRDITLLEWCGQRPWQGRRVFDA